MIRLSSVASFLVVAAAAVGVAWLWRPDWFTAKPTQKIASAPKTEYYCPMHPQQRSDKPANCPICGMKMVLMPKVPEAAKTVDAGSAEIFVSPERRQLIGVSSVLVEHRPLAREIRTAGKVAVDETRITHVHTKIAGFVEELFVDFIGKPVKHGEALFTIYSPELVATQEEYLLALRSSRALKDSSFGWVKGGSMNLLEAARRRLQLWDVSDEEIRELEATGKSKRAITVHSPATGVVTQRAAYHHGKYITPEMELYTIADLSTVWILGEVFETDLPFLRLGQQVHIELPFASGSRVLNGRVAFISPMLDPKTRSGQVRLDIPNPDQSLRPEMFVSFHARVSFGAPLAIPIDAVMDSGSAQYVFLDKGDGYYEPRMVKLGPEADGYYAVESGLKHGDRVVTSANFLLDSESRLKGAFSTMGTPKAKAEKQVHD